MREKISAFLDGELDESDIDSVLGALGEDASLQQEWQLYNLIGDAMRGTSSGSAALAARVYSRLEGEPPLSLADSQIAAVRPAPLAVVADEAGVDMSAGSAVAAQRQSNRRRVAANRAWYSVAASVAGIAFVGWAAWHSLLPEAGGGAGRTMASSGVVPATEAVSQAQTVSYQARVSDYWAAHRQMSGHLAGANEQNVQFVTIEMSGEGGR